MWKFNFKQAAADSMTISPNDVEALINAEIETVFNDIAEVEGILRHIVTQQNSIPTPQQLSYFTSKGWEVNQHVQFAAKGKKHLRQQLSRMARVIRNEMVAGTAEERKKLTAALEAAKQRAATEGAKLRAQIAELQSKLEPIDKAPETLQRRLDETLTAVERLRELVPSELRTIAVRLRGDAKRNSNVPELEAAVTHLEQIVSLEPGSAQMLAFCDALTVDHPCKRKAKEGVDGVAWDAFQADAREKLKKLKPRAESERAKLDTALVESRAILDFYIR